MDAKYKTNFRRRMAFAVLAILMLLQVPLGGVAIESSENPEEEPQYGSLGDAYDDGDLGDDNDDGDLGDDDNDWHFGGVYNDGDLGDDNDDGDLGDDGNDWHLGGVYGDGDLGDDNEDESLGDDEDESLGDEDETAEVSSRSANRQITTMRRSGVTRRSATFRRGPGANYATIRTISGNTNLRITGRTGSWYRVVVNGTTGWLRQSAVARTRQNAVVITNNAHVRAGRGSNHRSLTRLPRGQRVTVRRRTGTWSRVTVNGHTGWIRNSDLRTTNAMRPGRTIADDVAVHTRPRSNSNVRHTLPRHSQLMIVQRTTDGWSQVRIRHNGGTLRGWVRTSQIENRTHTRRLVRNGALRSGPSTNFNRMRTISRNTRVTVRSRVGNWYHVHVNINGTRHYGWLHQNNLPRLTLDANVGAGAEAPTWGVTYGVAQLRRGAGTNYGVIKTIADSTLIGNISRRSGSWLRVTFDGQTGWIHHDSIRVATTNVTTTTHYGRTNAATDLRRGAGNGYGVIRRLSNNTNVAVLRQSGSWLRVRAGDDEGWVREYRVNSTTPGTTNISVPLRDGPGNSHNEIRRVPSGVHLTILRHRGNWVNVRVEGQTGWINMLYVNVRTVIGDVPDVVSRVGSEVHTINVSGETGLRLIVPRRRTLGAGHAFDVLEGVRVEHTNANGHVTRVPITWHEASSTWRFTHSGRTFTITLTGTLDNITPGTYERDVVVNRGQTVVAQGRQVIVVR